MQQLLRDEIGSDSPDFIVVRFLLRRLGQLGDASMADEVLDHLDHIYPAFAGIVESLGNLRNLDDGDSKRLGGRVLDSLQDSI